MVCYNNALECGINKVNNHFLILTIEDLDRVNIFSILL